MNSASNRPPHCGWRSRTLEATAALVIGGVLVFSAASKLTSPIEFRDELHSYGLLDVRASMFAALYLILLELGMGLSFWRKASRGVSFVAAALLFSVFLCALAYKRSLGDTNHCGCFGSSTPGTLAQMVWLDTVLLAVCVLGAVLSLRRDFGRSLE